ncbi:hypothetical protein [Halorubrum ezzemoulense]|uniref:hypothetical protein n=1 Tax=Halorubrum ezzemoulense TaxID=337243 RepID=UPI0023303570|nr:hypothetical protein [Halorubrum ezzemoulense]MDB9233859.1 hypothetical protein [Halorubrum ezzemoulense]
MFDNETPYPWRGAFVEWIGVTLLWSIVWMLPFVGMGLWTIDGEPFFFTVGSLGLPFISGYLLFRTVARMITRENDPDQEPERVTQEELRSS